MVIQIMSRQQFRCNRFSSGNWIRRGYQKRFETVNANNLAVTGRLDYKFAKNSEIRIFVFFGNSADNRLNPDIDFDAYVSVFDFYLIWEASP
ncbi:hypothetical protein N9157_01650 [Saprospiraceae bacterium]|jgi:hypothetical protein|nr:hypothetical protein [Saprospiraceae bacterium]